MEPARFASFREFYPYYLHQHAHRTSRRLHVAGTLYSLRGDFTMCLEVLSGRRRF